MTTTLPILRLKKGEERRILAGHPWIYSNEIDNVATPLKSFTRGQTVLVEAYNKTLVGVAYVNPHSLIAARLFSRNPKDRLNVEFIQTRLASALAFRDAHFDKPFYRLCFSEADGLPGLVIDRFGVHLVCQINTAGMAQVETQITEALLSLLPDTQSILLRNDSQIREQEGLPLEVKAIHGQPPEVAFIEENHVQFQLPLWEGQKTGWFYDHRQNRARLAQYVKDKRVLDVFSYLGAWGIQAAALGATSVDCVESSALACNYIRKNAELNKLTDRVHVINNDAFDAMKALLSSGKKYNVITLDPPAFVKRLKDQKEGMLAYQRINELAVKLLAEDGILFTCSCSMHVSMTDLTQMLQRVSYRTDSRLQLLERGHQGVDHPVHLAIPETDYLKAMVVRKF